MIDEKRKEERDRFDLRVVPGATVRCVQAGNLTVEGTVTRADTELLWNNRVHITVTKGSVFSEVGESEDFTWDKVTFVPNEHVLCAALHYKDGKVHPHQPVNVETGIVICGRRHHNCYAVLAGLLGHDKGKLLVGKSGQGFLTDRNRFVGRKEAYLIAKKAGQLLREDSKVHVLTSEDIY